MIIIYTYYSNYNYIYKVYIYLGYKLIEFHNLIFNNNIIIIVVVIIVINY